MQILVSFQAKIFTFPKHRISEIIKTDFFRKIFQKTFISASQTLDKIENAKNNEIKSSILRPDSLKSLQNHFLRHS